MHLSYIIPISTHYARKIFDICQGENVDIDDIEKALAEYANDVVSTKTSFDTLYAIRKNMEDG